MMSACCAGPIPALLNRIREETTMQAWLCENPVGVDALTWKELPTPTPQSGEVLIEIEAASLNFPDALIVQNKYQMKPPLPFVPGSEYAGTIRAVPRIIRSGKRFIVVSVGIYLDQTLVSMGRFIYSR